MTPPLSISDPVAARVKTVKIGNAFFTETFLLKKSQGSKSTQAPAAIHFVASIVDPPPTASKTSIFLSLHNCAPSLTELILGFG